MKKIFTFAALMMLGIMGVNAQETYVLSSETATSVKDDPSPWKFVTEGKEFTITSGKNYAAGDQKTVKYSRNHNFTLNIPEDVTVAKVIFEGYSNADSNDDNCYVSKFNGVEVAPEDIVRFNARNYDGHTSKNVPFVSSEFTLAEPQTGGSIEFSFGGQQAAVIIKVITAAAFEPGTATFDFTTDDLHVHGSAAGEQGAQVYNEHFIVDNVDMQLVGGQIPVRCYSNSSKGSFMQFGKGSQIILRAPEGGAITKVEFTIAGSGSINVTPSSGEFADGVWTGNATSLRMNVESSAAYLASVAVSYDKATEESDAMPGVLYTDVNGLAELATLAKGTIAKLTLTDAEVIAKTADGWGIAFIQDAGAGAWIQYSSLVDRLREETKISGTFYVTKNLTSNNGLLISEAEETPASQFEESDIEELSMVKGTLTEVNVAANAERVVKISGAAFKVTKVTGNAEQGELTQDDQTITVNNGFEGATNLLHKLQFVEGTEYQSCTIVAILSAKSKTAFQLLPLSIVEDDATSIESVARETAPAAIYNLQGQRISKLQKGLNIVDGKKVMF